MKLYRYQQIEQQLQDEIASGQRKAGERLPSIRALCRQLDASKSTVLYAYANLEAQGFIEARPRSGYFVCQSPASGQHLKAPEISQPSEAPAPVAIDQVLTDIMEQGAAFDILPSDSLALGNDQLRRSLARAHRQQKLAEQDYYDEPRGFHGLREQLAQRYRRSGTVMSDDDLLMTSGCQHALLLALMATTKPGDIVGIESPGFYGAFQLLEALGLQALELPSSPETGVSLSAIESSIERWGIKALLISPCYSTPTGAAMPEDNKRRLIELVEPHDMVIIEDDIYAELHFQQERLRPLYSYDTSGRVLLCSSLSKCLSRDLRVGWIAPGKYMEPIKRLKVMTSLASSQAVQRGVSQFLQGGGLDKHLRKKRTEYQLQCQQLQQWLPSYLPKLVSCSQPSGGMALWLELQAEVDTLALYNKAKEAGIIITPGQLFTSQNKYRHFIRVSFSQPWTDERKEALVRLGQLM